MTNKSKWIYNFINIGFLLITLIFFFQKRLYIINPNFTIFQFFLLVLLIIFIHSLKFFKLYFIVLEEKIPFKNMLKIYIKSTFSSIVLPFKIGEIYKAYLIGHEIKNYKKGIIAVLIDKFYDAIILCISFICYSIIANVTLTITTWILLIIIIMIVIVYYSFPGTYRYLNRFFIQGKHSNRNIYVLRVLESLESCYTTAKEMICGRSLLFVSLGIFYWLGESVFIYFVVHAYGLLINFGNVVLYVNDAFLGINNPIFNVYVSMCTLLFIIAIAFIYFEKYFLGGNNEKVSSHL